MALVKSVNKYTITLSAGTASNFAALPTSNFTLANCIPFVSKHITDTPATADDWSHMAVDCYLTDTPANRVYVQTTNSTSRAVVCEVTVVEFNSTEVEVQSGTYTIGTDAHSNTATPGSALTIANSFLVHYNKVADTGGLLQRAMIRGKITGTTELTFDRGFIGTGTPDAVVADANWTNASGSNIDLGSAGADLPTMSNGDRVRIGSATNNNDFYTATGTPTASSVSLTAENISPQNGGTETITVTVDSGTGMGAIDGHWFTAEALASEFSVQHVDFDMDDGTTQVDETITSVTTNKTFLVGSANADDRCDDNINFAGHYYELTSATNARMKRKSGSGELWGTCQVISLTGSETVFRSLLVGTTNWGIGQTPTYQDDDFDATGVSSQSNSMISFPSTMSVYNHSADGTGSGDAPGGMVSAVFLDDNTARVTRYANGEVNQDISYEVVEWEIDTGGATRRVMII